MFSLPTELLIKIIFYLTPKDAIKIYSLDKKTLKLFDSTTQNGKYIWQKYREYLNFPDPSSINLSDFVFLKAYYTRGCNFCPNKPRIRKVVWQFFGKKFCDECLQKYTIRSYLLTTSIPDLPCIQKTVYKRGIGEFYYEMYLKVDIEQISNDAYIQERINTNNVLIKFIHDLENAEYKNECREKIIKRHRINMFVEKEFLEKDIYDVLNTEAYNNAINSKSNYSTNRGKTMLKNSIKKELETTKFRKSLYGRIKTHFVQNGYTDEEFNFVSTRITNHIDTIDTISKPDYNIFISSIENVINTKRYRENFKAKIIKYVKEASFIPFSDYKIVKTDTFEFYKDEMITYKEIEKIGRKILEELIDEEFENRRISLQEQAFIHFCNFTVGKYSEKLRKDFLSVKKFYDIDVYNNRFNIDESRLTPVKEILEDKNQIYYCKCGFCSRVLVVKHKIQEHVDSFHKGDSNFILQ